MELNQNTKDRSVERNESGWSKLVTWRDIINRVDSEYQGLRSVERNDWVLFSDFAAKCFYERR